MLDAPWRALPTSPPETREKAEMLNQILKDYLFLIEKRIIKDFKAKIYKRLHSDWFELFLVTFIDSVIHNGYDPDAFHLDEASRSAMRRSLGIPDDAFLLGSISRWNSQKDIPNLLRETGDKLVGDSKKGRVLTFRIRKA